MNNSILFSRFLTLPDDLKKEALEFIELLMSKAKKVGPPKKRKFGRAKGMFIIQPDFNEPLGDLQEYME